MDVMDDNIDIINKLQYLARALRRRLRSANNQALAGARPPRSLEDLYFPIGDEEELGPSAGKRRRAVTTKAPRQRATGKPAQQAAPSESNAKERDPSPASHPKTILPHVAARPPPNVVMDDTEGSGAELDLHEGVLE